ncbi:P-loop containing nucleoside triphosphate hydrolase protein [Trichoderma citrinoviride]|uniref:P-loop containing nucleoside triphosphate hydrolase protein n=1 Tax=Trichoderma citrinoviride TaxID=58853 RepID=A0A2T4AYP6_9HYPO|nr:P-loop containing nucleoside triphosphate hydrolase protein [Trichoderma citrinoviride]PTB62192.1 P-loop containing nucleoside triphosphate hydrolase protein [Trichoderma citrinoviride]
MQLKLRFVSNAASTLFLLALPFRLWKLRREAIKVLPGHRGYAKLTLAAILAIVQLVLLTTTLSPGLPFDIDILSAITSLIACLGLCPLVFLEHTRSIRPSDLSVLYLGVTLACDSVDLWTTVYEDGVTSDALWDLLPAIVSICIKLVLVVVESQRKDEILRESSAKFSPEELSGVLSRTFFWWINPILAQGWRNILTEDSLPPIGAGLSSKLLRHQASVAWDQRAKPIGKLTLPKVLIATVLPHFLAPILPRLCLIIFRYSQPVLIRNVIRYLDASMNENTTKRNYTVVVMAIVVYVGLAISKGVYQQRLNRLKVMIRGAVVGLIHRKSLNHVSANYDDGKAVTLMSTDAENIIEVLIGTAMLAKEVGWIFPVPIVIIFFCSRMSRYLAKNLQSKQKSWNEATQRRLSMTTSMLSSMKSLKMLGVAPYTENLIRNLRLQELAKAKRVRWMMVAYNASANALGIFSPIITFVLFALVARWNGTVLDAETAFTTTALLGLVTHPANMIMSIIPEAVGSLAAFERIQQYLLQPPRHDQRVLLKKLNEHSNDDTPAISLEQVTIQISPSAPPILSNISLVVKKGSIVICSGPVGSGKSTLAKALIGELPLSSGTISVSSKRIGSCEQVSWLPSGTIKEAIIGFTPDDPDWYNQVVRLCCLDEDIATLPQGHRTLIGSRGLNLSGGQRQRVALARAIYARCDIVVLDDTFSALDGKTENRIVENILGPNGHFRKMGTTVFLITNSDWLIVLADSSIQYQGTAEGLKDQPQSILKVNAIDLDKTAAEEQLKVDSTVQKQTLKVADAISDLSRATGDLSLYASYSFFVTFPQYWLNKWTAAPPSDTMFYIGGYLILSLLAWTSTNGSMWSTNILIASDSGAELHRRTLSTVIGAPLSFFSTTDIGVILNRFSQDIQLVDRQLPPAILSISNQVFKILVQTALLFAAQKLMAVSLPVCIVTVYFIQKVYLQTSRQLRLLELESQSAVYSSFLESVEGVATIRAFGWERQIENANINYLDKSQQPSYILFCLQRWLNIVLDLMIAAIATGLITLAVVMKGTTTSGQIGMALNIVLVVNTTLLSLVESWTNLEISLGAIARLKNLEAETPKEDKPGENYVPVDTWPSLGEVELDNATVAYNADAIALRNISMKISPGEQLVVCGRTGSGKSTLLLTLLRLLDAKSGTIKVDGVDLSLVPRTLVRQRCFITVAQDPFILGQASLRFNLDPSASFPDEIIVKALEKTRLWSHFKPRTSIVKPSVILSTSMAALPQMSTGQLQLLALARAILQVQHLNSEASISEARPNGGRVMPILLLDEATSSLDPATESAMRSIIQEEFTDKGNTVVAITHRLGGIAGNGRAGKDTVALLSNGKIEKMGKAEDILGDLISP